MLALRRAAQRLAADALAAGGTECSTSGRVAAQAAARFSAAAAELEQGEDAGKRGADVGSMARHWGMRCRRRLPPPLASSVARVPYWRATFPATLAEPTLVAELRGSAGSIASNKLRKVGALCRHCLVQVPPALPPASERARQCRTRPSLLRLGSPWLCSGISHPRADSSYYHCRAP